MGDEGIQAKVSQRDCQLLAVCPDPACTDAQIELVVTAELFLRCGLLDCLTLRCQLICLAFAFQRKRCCGLGPGVKAYCCQFSQACGGSFQRIDLICFVRFFGDVLPDLSQFVCCRRNLGFQAR